MKHRILLTAQASVSCAVEIEADSTEEAETKAIDHARSGNVVWEYDGVDDESIEVGI